MADKKILLIAFRFPPMGGVGSRRWAKFVKYLSRRNYKIHVVTIKYPYADKINWEYDVRGKNNITIHRIKSGCPSFLISPPSLFSKIASRLFNKTYGQLFFYLDYAQGWHRHLIPYARKLIRSEGIQNVIATGPPSSVHYTATYLKIENPLINLIQDFRDSWNDDIDYEYGTSLGYFSQKEKSVMMEDFSLMHTDKVCFVTQDIKERYENIYDMFRRKFHVIHNGYDREDYKVAHEGPSDFTFSMVYTGNMGLGREKFIPLFAEVIQKKNDEYINRNLKIVLYSNLKRDSFRHDQYWDAINKHFIFNDFIPSEEIADIIAKHPYCLSINSEKYPYAFGTKIFDYMGLGKKIIHISNGGELYDILNDRGHFVSTYDIQDVSSTLLRIKNDFMNFQNKQTFFPEFDIEKLTDKIEILLQE